MINFTVGNTYKDKSGQEWKCLYVHDNGDAHLEGVYDDDLRSCAYSWQADGTPICLRSDPETYTIVPEIEVKTFDVIVEVMGTACNARMLSIDGVVRVTSVEVLE